MGVGGVSGCWIESHKGIFGCQLTLTHVELLTPKQLSEKVGEGLGTLPTKENE